MSDVAQVNLKRERARERELPVPFSYPHPTPASTTPQKAALNSRPHLPLANPAQAGSLACRFDGGGIVSFPFSIRQKKRGGVLALMAVCASLCIFLKNLPVPGLKQINKQKKPTFL